MGGSDRPPWDPPQCRRGGQDLGCMSGVSRGCQRWGQDAGLLPSHPTLTSSTCLTLLPRQGVCLWGPARPEAPRGGPGPQPDSCIYSAFAGHSTHAGAKLPLQERCLSEQSNISGAPASIAPIDSLPRHWTSQAGETSVREGGVPSCPGLQAPWRCQGWVGGGNLRASSDPVTSPRRVLQVPVEQTRGGRATPCW